MKKNVLGVALFITLACAGALGSQGADSLHAAAVPPSEVVTPQIEQGSRVTLLYVISVPGYGYIDSDVSEFIHGEHEIFPALERVIVGMKPQEEKNAILISA